MIRTLAMIAVAGFLLSAVCISIAVAMAGPEAVASGAWSWAGPGWRTEWDHHGVHRSRQGGEASRELTWSGGDKLEIALPAQVRFTQTDGPAKLVVLGPQDTISHVVVEDGRLSFDRMMFDADDVVVELSAPKVTHFALSGEGGLTIDNYRQDTLDVRVSGDGDVTARGAAKTVTLDISGSGDADLTALDADGAQVRISGAGEAKVGPKAWARLDISGAGDVTLTSRPKRVESHVSGSGRVEQDDSAPDAGVSASPSPSRSASPSPGPRPART